MGTKQDLSLQAFKGPRSEDGAPGGGILFFFFLLFFCIHTFPANDQVVSNLTNLPIS